MARILVLSASVGAGHLRAAQAVELALRELDPSSTVQNVDVLQLTNATFRRLYGKAYLDLAHKAPYLIAFFYDLLDQPPNRVPVGDKLRLLVQKLNLGPFLKLLEGEPWDLIVNTHFMPAEIVASLRRKKKLATPQFIVTTDFETHGMWVHSPCERFFTATEEGAAYLASFGIPAKDISATGIPIHPLFSRTKDRSVCLKSQGLRGDRPVVLQLAGGFGVGPIQKIFEGILQVETPLEVVVVTGKNEDAKERIARIKPPERHVTKVFGFTDQMDELLAAADLVVSKPGGLTTSEVLARGAAMAVVNPMPGQECRNSDFLLENGAAVKINNLATLPLKLSQLLGDAGRLARLKENARRLGRPQAAFDIAREALRWAKGSR